MVLYTLYFIFYSVYTFPPAPTASTNPCLAYSLSLPPLPLLFIAVACTPFLEARILCRWRSHSASSLSLPLSLSIPVPIFLKHLCSESRATATHTNVRTSRAAVERSMRACAQQSRSPPRVGRASAKEKHFSGALLLSLGLVREPRAAILSVN